MEERFIRVSRTARYHVLGDAAKAKSMWVVIHGYGHLARFFLNKFEGLARDRLVVAPEGLSRFYLDEAHQRVGATWMTREDREHEIEDHIGYLDALAGKLHELRPDLPLQVLGFSQGVATAWRWSMQGRSTMERLVCWAGSMPLEPTAEQLSAWRHPKLDIVFGTRDPLVGEEAQRAMEGRLRNAAVPFAAHRYDGGHELEPVLLARLFR